MFCHKCGEQLAEGASFCHKCGTKIVYEDNGLWPADTSAAADEHGETNRKMQKNGTVSVQKIETGHAENGNGGDFKMFVDNHVRETTKFQSADDLLKNSKPWGFVWKCVAIPSVIGFILGAGRDPMEWLLIVLVFGGFFGYVAVWIASGIIRTRYRTKFSGEFDHNINTDELILFLNGHLKQVSPYFHEFGYFTQQGGLLTSVENVVSNALKEIILCCEFGPKKKSLATICMKPDMTSTESGQMRYIVDAVRNGFMMDGRAAGFFGHACLIRTAPILQAAMEYYLKNYKE